MTQFVVILVILLAGLALAGLGSLWLRYREEIRTARRRIEGLGARWSRRLWPGEYARSGRGLPCWSCTAPWGASPGLWLARGFDLCKYQVISLSVLVICARPCRPAPAWIAGRRLCCPAGRSGDPSGGLFAASAGTTAALRRRALPRARLGPCLIIPRRPGEAQMSCRPLRLRHPAAQRLRYWILVTFWGRWVQNAIGLVPRGYALTPENRRP
jgi:hypothetical protein